MREIVTRAFQLSKDSDWRDGSMEVWRRAPILPTFYSSKLPASHEGDRIKELGANCKCRIIKNESGLSLVAVLWIVMILTIIATEFLYSVRLEQRIQGNMVERTKMFYAAKAGLETFIAQIRDDETPYDALTEDWAEGITGAIEDGMRANNALSYKVTVTDEASKINITTADENMLQGVLALAGVSDEETAQTLAQAIIQTREEKFRTVGDLAKVEGMTPEILYGNPQQLQQTSAQTQQQTEVSDEEQQAGKPLIDLVTVHSVDKNVDAEGQKRVDLNSANQEQLSQIQDENQQPILSSQEAQAIIDQRDQKKYESIGDLFDTPAVSENMFNEIKDRITIGDEQDSGEGGENKVNINTAGADELQNLPSIDQGVAEDIIRYRDSQGEFNNVDEIRNAKVVNIDDMRVLSDKLATSNEPVVAGKINVNTAPVEILQLLPGMDEQKAQAIIAYREVDTEKDTDQQGGPFENIGQLLNVEGIDENTFRQIVDLVTYRSYAFQAESEGLAADNKPIASCNAIIDRTGDAIQIKQWRQRW
ncbi:MAG: helix-hairpin-helix domain-containing protein [Candidatus Poribacteria bacterium]